MVIPKNSCNGLVLCLCWKESPRGESDYVAWNPATEEWVVLPDSIDENSMCTYHLGFDPALSTHFHVFQIDADENYGVVSALIYTHQRLDCGVTKKVVGMTMRFRLLLTQEVPFFNGTLHLLTYEFQILAVDTEDKTWRTISVPETMCARNSWFCNLAFIGHSQERLYYINMRDSNTSKLSIGILEDSNCNEWILKYSISTVTVFWGLFSEKDIMFQRDYALIAVHPECSLIFFVWRPEDVLLSYDMDRGKICVIHRLKDYLCDEPFPQYVPFYSCMGRPRVEA